MRVWPRDAHSLYESRAWQRDRPFRPHGGVVSLGDEERSRLLVYRTEGRLLRLEQHDVDGSREGVELTFPSHIIPNVQAFVEDDSVVVLALTSGGTLFRIQFDERQPFSKMEGGTRYSAFPLVSPSAADAVLVHAATAMNITVALASGSLLQLTLHDDRLHEQELSSGKLFSRLMTAVGLRSTEGARPVCMRTLETVRGWRYCARLATRGHV